jgi:hypothetical protein
MPWVDGRPPLQLIKRDGGCCPTVLVAAGVITIAAAWQMPHIPFRK